MHGKAQFSYYSEYFYNINYTDRFIDLIIFGNNKTNEQQI